MDLISGIKVFSKFDINNRIELSDGVINNFSLNREVYGENAYLPNLPWRSLTSSEKDILIAKEISPNDHANNISIIQLPESLIEKILYYFNAVSPFEKNMNFLEEEDFLLATANVIEHLEENYLIRNDNFEIAGFSVNDVFHLQTTTYDTQRKKYTGIHLDDWSNEGLYERGNAANRICINLGKESRYFLFINLSMLQIFDLCAIDDEETIDLVIEHPGCLIGFFFEKYGTYPIVRIKLNPGEAYIAPTENIPHDGSTFGNTSTDINLTLRGFFKLNQE